MNCHAIIKQLFENLEVAQVAFLNLVGTLCTQMTYTLFTENHRLLVGLMFCFSERALRDKKFHAYDMGVLMYLHLAEDFKHKKA